MHLSLPLTAVWLYFTAASLAQSYIWRQNVIEGCSLWWDNDGDRTCVEVRDGHGISPETFARWNPSVGLNCENWEPYTSFCVGVESEMADPSPSTTSLTSTRTTPTPSAKPSPVSWSHRGCYSVGTLDSTTLDKSVGLIHGNNPADCQHKCFTVADIKYRYAAVWGPDCWCGTFLRRGPSDNGAVDCNLTCHGDATKTCGGSSFMDVYEADFSETVDYYEADLSEPSEESPPFPGIATVMSSTVVGSPTVAATVDSPASSSRTTQLWLWGFGSGLAGYLFVL